MKGARKMLMSDYELNPAIVKHCSTVISDKCGGMEKGGKTLHCLMKFGKRPNPDNFDMEKEAPECFKSVCLSLSFSIFNGATTTHFIQGGSECSAVLFNSRTAIAGPIIGLLLVFYDSKRSVGFLKVFNSRPHLLSRLLLRSYFFLLRQTFFRFTILPLFRHFAWNLFDFSRLVSLFSHSA